jgi:hypothetical protein
VPTYAPRGRTPGLRGRLTRDHLSAIGAVTPAGQLLLHPRPRAFQGPDVVRFLRHLLRHLPGRPLVRWDGAPIPHAQPVKAFRAAGAAARLPLEQLPGYAPALNPLDQGVWQQRKHVELATVCWTDLPHLRRELHSAAKRLRRRPHVIHGCIRHAGYRLEHLVHRSVTRPRRSCGPVRPGSWSPHRWTCRHLKFEVRASRRMRTYTTTCTCGRWCCAKAAVRQASAR